MSEGHRLYLDMNSNDIFLLPEFQKLDIPALQDIRQAARPVFSGMVSDQVGYTADGVEFHPGSVPVSVIDNNHWLSSIVIALAKVPPLRNFFLFHNIPRATEFLLYFSELFRKIWNPVNLRGFVSPYKMLYEILNMIEIDVSDPFIFLSWLLNTLQTHLIMAREEYNILKLFRGRLEILSSTYSGQSTQGKSPFLMLSLDLPSENVTLNLVDLLGKFQDQMDVEVPHEKIRRRYRITRLPGFLILHYRRFISNMWGKEKRKSLVQSPISGLSVNTLAGDWGNQAVQTTQDYELLVNICHVNPSVDVAGPYIIHSRLGMGWVQITPDAIAQIPPEMVATSQPYIQIWERK